MPAIVKHITERSNLNDLYWFEIADFIYKPIFLPANYIRGYCLETITIGELRDRINELRPDLKDFYSNISDAKATIELQRFNPLSLTNTYISEFSDDESMISTYNLIINLSDKSSLVNLLASTNNKYSEEFYDSNGNRLNGISILER